MFGLSGWAFALLWVGRGFTTVMLLLLSLVLMQYGCRIKLKDEPLFENLEEAIFAIIFTSVVSWPLAVLVVPILLIVGLCMVIARLSCDLIVNA